MLLTITAIGLLYAFITFYMIREDSGADYLVHITIAKYMLSNHAIITPHFLYHLLTIIINWTTTAGFDYSALAASTLLAMLTGGAIYLLFLYETGSSCQGKTRWYISAATFAVVVAGPIIMLYPLDGHAYLGYNGINVFHNPTMLALKPFALLLFALSCRMFEHPEEQNYRTLSAIVLLAALSISAKPNMIICLIPTLLTVSFWQRWRKGNVPYPALASLFIPSALILAWQYYVTYSTGQATTVMDKSRIIFMPFEVMSHYSNFLLLKFLLSILFPLAILLLYMKKTAADLKLVMAWILFFFGAFYTYFLAETGERMYDGNFFWSGQISLFILFIYSTLFLFREGIRQDGTLKFNTRASVCLALFTCHLLSGLFFYFLQLHNPTKVW